jgi:hypothetical protein
VGASDFGAMKRLEKAEGTGKFFKELHREATAAGGNFEIMREGKSGAEAWSSCDDAWSDSDWAASLGGDDYTRAMRLLGYA